MSRQELNSDSDSDSLNSNSSVIRFAFDIVKQREAAQALQELSNTRIMIPTTSTCGVKATISASQSNQTLYQEFNS